ncbi:MAG: symmetrical bis(5'-nucleosyl)-tetraphosphatase [Rhodoferax sp.]
MALYLIGDIQGCHEPLQKLLAKLDFSASRDTLFVLGDLVNRGPDSLAVLRHLRALDGAAQCLLGNHDLHLLAAACGARRPSRRDTLREVLEAPDRAALLDWLRRQRMALRIEHGQRPYLLVHAGVLPQWSAEQTLALAREFEDVLTGPDLDGFLYQMYDNQPDRWDDALRGVARLRLIVNALTRLRFCTAEGVMDFETKEGLDAAPPGLMPWFDVPGRRSANVTVAFGHWSTLGWLDRDDVLSLDSGCVWGGQLTALRLAADGRHERVRVRCPQAQKPSL